jgi:thiol-disulfide isomerase/thioredoxin
MMNRFIMISIFILAGQLVRAQDEFTLAKKGSMVPQFTYESAPGAVKRIGDLKGKVVLITFFATWCGPCRQELPHIEKEIYQKYGTGGPFELLIFGREHDWATVNKFKTDQKFTMPFYPDTGRVIFSKFAGQNIPRNFLLDREGKIIFSTVGFNEKDFNKLKQVIEKEINRNRLK